MRLSGWSLPLERLSASSISSFITCPEAFRQRYIKKAPEKMFPDRFLGIVDHAVQARNFKWKMELGRDMDLELLKGLYGEVWKEVAEKEGETVWGDTDPVTAAQTGLKMIEAYHTEASPTITPLVVEERFDLNLDGIPVPVVGYLDLVTTKEVLERKTAKVKVAKPKSKWRFQGRIYQLATDLPVEWNVVTKQVEPKVYTATHGGIEAPDLRLEKVNPDTTVNMIRMAARAMNDTYARYGPDSAWPPNGLYHEYMCSYCGYGPEQSNSCFAWRN